MKIYDMKILADPRNRKCFVFHFHVFIGVSKERGARDAPPHLRGPNSLIFMQFSAKNLQNNRLGQENPGYATDFYSKT